MASILWECMCPAVDYLHASSRIITIILLSGRLWRRASGVQEHTEAAHHTDIRVAICHDKPTGNIQIDIWKYTLHVIWLLLSTSETSDSLTLLIRSETSYVVGFLLLYLHMVKNRAKFLVAMMFFFTSIDSNNNNNFNYLLYTTNTMWYKKQI